MYTVNVQYKLGKVYHGIHRAQKLSPPHGLDAKEGRRRARGGTGEEGRKTDGGALRTKKK